MKKLLNALKNVFSKLKSKSSNFKKKLILRKNKRNRTHLEIIEEYIKVAKKQELEINIEVVSEEMSIKLWSSKASKK